MDGNTQIEINTSEAVLLIGRNKLPSMSIKVENLTVIIKHSIIYLGVEMDKDIEVTEDVKVVTKKAEAYSLTYTDYFSRASTLYISLIPSRIPFLKRFSMSISVNSSNSILALLNIASQCRPGFV